MISKQKTSNLKPKPPPYFKVNKFITLKLEGNRTNIYVKGQLFNQCKFLLLSIPKKRISDYDEIQSIDEAAEKLDTSLEGGGAYKYEITPETEFWGHCSNIQAWAENNYNTRILHRNLAFPLLKKLADLGEIIARRVYKEEISLRLESGYPSVLAYLGNRGYIDVLSDEEFKSVVEDTGMMENMFGYLAETNRGNNLYLKRILNKAERLSHDFISNMILEYLKSNNLKLYRGLSRFNYFKNMDPSLKNELLSSPDSILKELLVECKGEEYFLKHDLSLKLMKKGISDMREIRGLRRLKHLRVLDLRENDLTDIHGLENCENLRRLKLKGNPLPQALMNRLGGLTKYGIAKKPKMFVEYCKRKGFDNMPTVKVNGEEFESFRGALVLKHLRINSLAEIKGLNRLKDLYLLDLSNNNISDLNGIENLTSLKILNLQYNQIDDASGIEKLENLEELRLYGNGICEIPIVEKKLKNLKKLCLDSTRVIDERLFLKYLLQSLTMPQMRVLCRDFQVPSFSRRTRNQLIEYIPNGLNDENLVEVASDLEKKIILEGIKKALERISATSRNIIRDITLLNKDKQEYEVLFKHPRKWVKIKISINSTNLNDPERSCECKIGAGKGFCEHFWIAFIIALKLGYFKIEDWKLTILPKVFERELANINIITNKDGKMKLVRGKKT